MMKNKAELKLKSKDVFAIAYINTGSKQTCFFIPAVHKTVIFFPSNCCQAYHSKLITSCAEVDGEASCQING